VEAFAREEVRVLFIAVAETKLPKTATEVAPPNFYVAARKDRENRRGGGVIWMVHRTIPTAPLALPRDAPPEVELAGIQFEDEAGARIHAWVSYRAPGVNPEPHFDTVARLAGAAARDQADFMLGGDLNVRDFADARQIATRHERTDRYSPSQGSRTPRPRHGRDYDALAALLRTNELNILSGTKCSCGPDPSHAATHQRQSGQRTDVSEIDYLLGCPGFTDRVRRTGTENGNTLSLLGDSAPYLGHHVPIWANFQVNVRPPTRPSIVPQAQLPAARWRKATDATYADLIALSKNLLPLIAKLEQDGYSAWGGDVEAAAEEEAAALVALETEAIGRGPKRIRRSVASPRRPWWTEEIGRLEDEEYRATNEWRRRAMGAAPPTDLTRAATGMEAARAAAAAADRRAHADFLEEKGDAAAHDEIRSHILERPRKGVGGGPMEWDQVRDAKTGAVLYGDEAVRYVRGENQRLADDDPDDPRFSVSARAEWIERYNVLMCETIPREIAEGRDALKELEARAAASSAEGMWCDGQGRLDWRLWEKQVLRGDRVPSRSEILAYNETPVTGDEIARANASLRADAAASPADGVSARLLKHGGPLVDRVRQLFLEKIRQDPRRRLPKVYRDSHQKDLYKGKNKDHLLVKSARPIQISSIRAKQFEQILKFRAQVTSFVDSAQAIGQRKIDARHLIHETHDAIQHENSYGRDVVAGTFDVVRGFPSLREEVATLSLHKQGERGSTLLCTSMLGRGCEVAIQVGPGQFTTPYELRLGSMQGRVRSPEKFAAATRLVTQRLRQHDCVLHLRDDRGTAKATFYGAFFADDLLTLQPSRGAFRRTFEVIGAAGVDVGFEWDVSSKLEISEFPGQSDRQLAAGDSTLQLDFEATPEPGTGRVATAAEYHGTHEVKDRHLSQLGFEYGLKGLDRRRARAAEEVERMQRLAAQQRDGLLRIGQELWTFEMHIYPTLTYCWACLPHLDDPTIGALEAIQQRAYLSQAAAAATPEGYVQPAIAQEVFGYESMADKLLGARLTYAGSLEQARTRARARESLRRQMVNDSSEGAAVRSGLHEYFEKLARWGAQDEIDIQPTPARRFWETSVTGALLRARAEIEERRLANVEARLAAGAAPRAWPSPAVDGLLDQPGEAEARLRAGAVKREIVEAAQRRRRTKLDELPSAAMVRAFAPTARWRRRVLRRLRGPRPLPSRRCCAETSRRAR